MANYTTSGKDILLDGKVVGTAPDATSAIIMARKSAEIAGGTFGNEPVAQTGLQSFQQPEAVIRQLNIEREAGLPSFTTNVGATEAMETSTTQPLTYEGLFAQRLQERIGENITNARDTQLNAPANYDTQLELQRAAFYAAIAGKTTELTPENLRWLSPSQQRLVREGDKSAMESALVGLNSIMQARAERRKEDEERAMRQFDLFLQSGTSPDQLPEGFLSKLDSQVGLPSGTFKSVYTANYSTVEAQRQSASLDAAIKLNTYLDSIPMGQTIKVGDDFYVGTGAGKIEINGVTGDVYSMRPDPTSPTGFVIQKVGNVGAQTNRNLEQIYNPNTGSYDLWSIDPNNPTDARPVTYGGSGGASTGGINTYSLMDAFPDGKGFSSTSWCVEWLRKIAEPGSLPDAGELNSIGQKAAYADQNIGFGSEKRPPAVGDYIMTNEDTMWGHMALITQVMTTPDGRKVAVLAESNYKPGQVTYGRTIELSDKNMAVNGGTIMGFRKAQIKSEFTSQSPLVSKPKETGLEGAPNSYKEWVFAGSPGNYEQWVKKTGLRPLPAAQATTLSEGFQIPLVTKGLNSLLDSNDPNNKINLFGPLTGLGAYNPWNEEARKVDADLRRASQVIGKFMEGGVLRKEDEEKYRKMLPQLTDTPNVARDKLVKVQELLTLKSLQYLDDYEAAGFDVSGFYGKLPGTQSMTSEEILVRRRSDGVEGTLPINEFDENLYERIQ